MSSEEGVSLFRERKFRLILSVSSIKTARRAISFLGRSDCSVFHALPVEKSCWWLPLTRNGQAGLGAPALRPSQFARALDQILQEIRARRTMASKQIQGVAFGGLRSLKIASWRTDDLFAFRGSLVHPVGSLFFELVELRRCQPRTFGSDDDHRSPTVC
jgi:hypothetical protein